MEPRFVIFVVFILLAFSAGVYGNNLKAWDDCTWTSANNKLITGVSSLDPQVTLTYPANILQIGTNHWNRGNGTQESGTITMIHEDGTSYGPWQTKGQPVYNVSNTWWWAFPDVLVKPGNYTIDDSDKSTLSANNYSQGMGFSSLDFDYLKPKIEEKSARLSIKRVDAPSSVTSCGNPEDMKIYWDGNPQYPITLFILPEVQDLQTYDWKTIISKYTYMNFSYPLTVPKALSCCQVDNSIISYNLVLVNGDGNMSDPFPISFNCPRYYLKD